VHKFSTITLATVVLATAGSCGGGRGDDHAQGGDRITGTGTARVVPDLSSPPHAIGHVNRFPTTIVLTGGTGKFAGIRGSLRATDFSKVVGIDTKTGIVHKIGEPTTYIGTITFP
jgi:hypothetical protein